MTKFNVNLKLCLLFILFGLAAGCSEKDSDYPDIRPDVFSLGTTFMNEMKASVERGDQEISEKIENLAYELKVVCIEKNDYSHFSNKEISFIDALGEIRVAYDELVFSRNPKYQTRPNEKESALEHFEQLVSDFIKKYAQSNH